MVSFICLWKRFIPDFKILTGNSKVTLLLNDYPSGTAVSSPLGPFTITSSTDKVDTRARGRLLAIKNRKWCCRWNLALWNIKSRYKNQMEEDNG